MVWPSVFLIIACIGFTTAGAAALVLQFSGRPPAATTPILSWSLIVGTAMLAASLMSMPLETSEDEDVPWIVQLMRSR